MTPSSRLEPVEASSAFPSIDDVNVWAGIGSAIVEFDQLKLSMADRYTMEWKIGAGERKVLLRGGVCDRAELVR